MDSLSLQYVDVCAVYYEKMLNIGKFDFVEILFCQSNILKWSRDDNILMTSHLSKKEVLLGLPDCRETINFPILLHL